MKLFAMFIVASRPKSRSRRAVCDERGRRYLRQVKSSSENFAAVGQTSSVPVSTLRSGAEAAVADTATRVTFRDAPIDRDQCSPPGSGHALRVVRSGNILAGAFGPVCESRRSRED